MHVIDPRQIDLPLLRQPLHFYPDASKAPDALKRIDAEIRGADAFVFLTAEYNRCIAPALTNTLDHFAPASYARRPSAIVSYSMGPQGGLSAALQVRSLAGELGCPSIGKMARKCWRLATSREEFSLVDDNFAGFCWILPDPDCIKAGKRVGSGKFYRWLSHRGCRIRARARIIQA